MDVVYERCCGIDVHKNLIVACFRCGRNHELRQFSATTKELRELTAWLKESDCQIIAMESTGSYWKPLYNIFELSDLEAIVVNPQHMKNLPGRKTDVKDAEWIADLLQHGLLKASFIPDREQRELREVTRYRKSLVGERSREINRLQKILEGANIKLSSVVSDIHGQSSKTLLKSMIQGTLLTEEAVSELLDPKMRKNLSNIMLAIDGVFSNIQKALAKDILDHIDDMTKRIENLDKLMNDYLEKYEGAIQKVNQIPGIGITSARSIIAEIGIDMSRFPSEAHISSWAGLSPGNNQSAGKKKSSKITKGNPALKSTLVQCAVVASMQKNTFYSAQYKRIATRRGKNRAAVAVAHSMLISIYHMLKDDKDFVDLGSEYYNQFNKERKINSLLKKLNDLGWEPAANPI